MNEYFDNTMEIEPMTEQQYKDRFFEDALDEILGDIRDTIICKRHDYGVGNIRKFGILGIMVRASDKLERLISLKDKEGQVKDETVTDTWRDLVGYGLIALLWLAGEYELPNKEK